VGATEPRPLVDVDQARIRISRDDAVVVDDPASPWLLRLWVRPDRWARPVVARIRIDVRNLDTPVTTARLARLPVGQLLQLAAVEAARTQHPNEAFYRMLARPRRPGQRRWDDEHWTRVLQVFDWGRATGRPGGGQRAVADLWGVAVNPTVWRWLAEARRRRGEDPVL
jgi:hypothetical protein